MNVETVEPRPTRRWMQGLCGDAAPVMGLTLVAGPHSQEDAETARQLLTLSALDGDANALGFLGELWEVGTGGPQSDEVAVSLYAHAAEQGSAYGAWRLGAAYLTGRAVEQDVRMALFWLCIASTLPNCPAGVMPDRDAVEALLSPAEVRPILLRALRWRPTVRHEPSRH